MLFSRKNKRRMLKLLGLFSVVRGYNILLVCLAQYLAAIFVFSKKDSLSSVLFNDEIFMLVLAGAFAIAGGYIINSFYDYEKDIINKPLKSMMNRLVSQNTKLSVYFLLNFFSVFIAGYVSFRAIVFFSAYIFGMWLYSHRIKKIPFWGNLTSASLAITPFFAIFIYYKNFDTVIFVHATFLFLLIWVKELIKDLENLKGDLAHNYQTIPVKYGENTSKIIMTIAILLCLIPISIFYMYFNIGLMMYYFLFTGAMLLLFLGLLWFSNRHTTYLFLHNMLKIILVCGVFGIMLLNPQMVLDKLWNW